MRTLLLMLVVAAPAVAQPSRSAPAAGALREVRIRLTDEWARVAESGVLTFPRQGLMTRATVVGIDTAGRPMTLGGLAPRWSTSDAAVVTTYGNPSDNPVGAAMGLVAQEDGRATITVSVAGKTATLPVVVGAARREIAASELAPKFRVARLELIADAGTAGPEAEASESGVKLRENGHGVLLRPRALAADGTVIPVEHFPVTWATSNDAVVEIFQTTDTIVQVTSHEPGTASISATLQGTTATVPVEVVKMGTSVGPMRGVQRVATAAGAVPIAKGEVATSAAASQAASTTSVTPRVVDSAARSGGIATTAPTATAAGTRATVPISRAGSPPLARADAPAPTGVSATPGTDGSVTVRWTPAPGASGHVVTWGRSAESADREVASVAGSGASAVVRGVPPGASWFAVSARATDGRAAGAADPVAVTMPAAPQPANFRAESGAGYVRLTWDSVPGAIGYTLARQVNGVATSLDDHVPARAPARLTTRAFVDASGPGSTVGYVLDAVYRAPDGAEFTGNPAAQPRTPATPLPLDAGTNPGITVTGFANQSNTLWVDYRTADATGWVSAIALEVLEPTGWRQVNGQSFSWTATDARYRAVPGARSGRLSLDPNIPGGCDHAKVFRLHVTRSVGGNTSPQQQVGDERSRPVAVTYDNASWRCHQ